MTNLKIYYDPNGNSQNHSHRNVQLYTRKYDEKPFVNFHSTIRPFRSIAYFNDPGVPSAQKSSQSLFLRKKQVKMSHFYPPNDKNHRNFMKKPVTHPIRGACQNLKYAMFWSHSINLIDQMRMFSKYVLIF